jgi:hypothetical protein
MNTFRSAKGLSIRPSSLYLKKGSRLGSTARSNTLERPARIWKSGGTAPSEPTMVSAPLSLSRPTRPPSPRPPPFSQSPLPPPHPWPQLPVWYPNRRQRGGEAHLPNPFSFYSFLFENFFVRVGSRLPFGYIVEIVRLITLFGKAASRIYLGSDCANGGNLYFTAWTELCMGMMLFAESRTWII